MAVILLVGFDYYYYYYYYLPNTNCAPLSPLTDSLAGNFVIADYSKKLHEFWRPPSA
jgi:hypothetical protein